MIHTFSVLSLQVKKLRRHNKSTIIDHLSNANPARGHKDVVFTLKSVLTSIQYLLFLTLEGKETNFCGHKLTQNKAQKNKNKIKKTQRNSPHMREKYDTSS